mgnify:FL=1
MWGVAVGSRRIVCCVSSDDLESFAGWTFDEHVRPQTTFFALEDGSPMPLDFIVRVSWQSECGICVALIVVMMLLLDEH